MGSGVSKQVQSLRAEQGNLRKELSQQRETLRQQDDALKSQKDEALAQQEKLQEELAHALRKRDEALAQQEKRLQEELAQLRKKNEDLAEELRKKDEELVESRSGEEWVTHRKKDEALRHKDAVLAQVAPGERARAEEEAQRVAEKQARDAAAAGLPARLAVLGVFNDEIDRLALEDLPTLITGIWFHQKHATVVAAALTAIIALMIGGPSSAKVFNLPVVGDKQRKENVSKAYAAGVLAVTLATMEKHSSERTVLFKACGVLWLISFKNPKMDVIMDDIRSRSGIRRLFGALDGYATDPALATAVLTALGTLMAGNDENKEEIVAASGIERIVEVMQVHPADADLQQSAILALNNLTLGQSQVAGPTAQDRLKAIGVEGPVRAAMVRPDATDMTKEGGAILLEKLPTVASDKAQEASARELAKDGHNRALSQLLEARGQAAWRADRGSRWFGGTRVEPPPPPNPMGGATPTPDKYQARKLVLGASQMAARGIAYAVGLDDERVLAHHWLDPVKSIIKEILDTGDENDCDNLFYIMRGEAQKHDDLPAQVKRDIENGTYHGGLLGTTDYDAGHAGWTLDDFCKLEQAVLAGLKAHHVIVLRLYTSSSYRQFNGPLRSAQRPHPWRFTLYVLADALKKLRVVDAELHPKEFNEDKDFYRGMADMTVDANLLKSLGGTELAPMSTTDNKQVAEGYAKSQCPLVFVFKTKNLTRGCCIDWLSLYPKEKEYLYPPLTFLAAEGDVYEVDGFKYINIRPQMS